MGAEHGDGVANFVPPDDPTLLRLALRSLIDHPQLRNTLALRAPLHALGYSERRMAPAYLRAYDAALARTEAAACAS